MAQIIPSWFKEPLENIRGLLAKANREIIVFAPYVRAAGLDKILPDTCSKITIVTSWRLHDLWQGSSDIELYPFTKDNSIKLYINNRIHLKVYMTDWESCILGSSNVSRRGLGISDDYNYELNTIIQEIDTNTQLYLRRIMSESTLVDDRIYGEYLIKLAELPDPVEILEPEVVSGANVQQLTIASLPMSCDIENLYKIYSNGFISEDTEAVQCAIHDVAYYDIPLGLSYGRFFNHLKVAFFRSAFVAALLERIDVQPIFFGETKAWLQITCSDVPVPSRRDLTGNVKVLYQWVVELGCGEYTIDRPNYSERLYKTNN